MNACKIQLRYTCEIYIGGASVERVSYRQYTGVPEEWYEFDTGVLQICHGDDTDMIQVCYR